MDLRLSAISGPLKGEIFLLGSDATSVGSSPSNHICITDSLVSPRHCLIEKNSNQCSITDLASQYGTYVNKLPVQQKLLEPGDCVRVGNTLLILLGNGQECTHVTRSYQSLEDGLIGKSTPMQEVHEFIKKVAPSTTTVLIQGESGTGKELAAQAIHLNSPRRTKPFVAINCAALSEQLLESELFGHEKGSFTGAFAQKKGRLEFADGGIVFLDEVGELAPSLQAKLLRMLQTHEFERVGGTHLIKIDIRLLSATNRNLEEAVKAGAFRADLYYRLAVVSLKMPSLRECREDVPLLAAFFAAKYGQSPNRQVAEISPQAHACLMNYDWPGNVRELQNVIERAVVLGSGNIIRLEDLPESVRMASPAGETSVFRYRDAIKQMRRQLVLKAMEQANGKCDAAAKALGLHPNHLRRMVRNLQLRWSLIK
jgi:transcriptional regulator with GAF, ATPase, and Fis domain